MYVPAFFEIFLGLVVVVLWGRWLATRPTTPAPTRLVPWVVGAGVLVGQAVAAFAVLQASTGAAGNAEQLVTGGRWGSFAVVGMGLLALGLATAASLLRAPQPDR